VCAPLTKGEKVDEATETRIAVLEATLEAHLKLNFIVLSTILRQDDRLKGVVTETLRQMLVSPVAKLSPELSQQVTALRNVLVLPLPQEAVEAARQPSIRPVE
jgi:hypothetical protein